MTVEELSDRMLAQEYETWKQWYPAEAFHQAQAQKNASKKGKR